VKLKNKEVIAEKVAIFYLMLYKEKNKRQSTTIFYFRKMVRVFIFQEIRAVHYVITCFYEKTEMGALLKGPLRALSGNAEGKCLRK
jgi:hypothetical protein